MRQPSPPPLPPALLPPRHGSDPLFPCSPARHLSVRCWSVRTPPPRSAPPLPSQLPLRLAGFPAFGAPRWPPASDAIDASPTALPKPQPPAEPSAPPPATAHADRALPAPAARRAPVPA